MSSAIDGMAINYTVRNPVGVAGLISPWNLPIYLLSWKIAPAIAVGNTVVCKPSEWTSVTAWMMASLFEEAGIPPGVINIVCGTGPSAGAVLVSHPEVPLISFTGGTRTGETITVLSAPCFKKLSLELGGKNPNIIFADANLDACLPVTVRSSFLNQGEICLCGSRIFVQEGIYEEFLKRFIEATKKLVVGYPFDPKTTTGPLISKQHFDKVYSCIQVAQKEGGKIELGGDLPTFAIESPLSKGYFINPTIITGLSQQCKTQQEEIFGPVVTITPFKTEEQVIEWANDIKYGLSSSIWTENLGTANRVALALEAGTVWINCWLARDLRVPFGGMKHSGIGREGGNFSIDFYTQPKTICMKYSK